VRASTLDRIALRRLTAAAWLLSLSSGAALGATLSSQSSIGISGEYASNPFLERAGAEAAEAVALVADLPATYTSDTLSIDLMPRFRLAQAYGPIALLSDYGYLDGDLKWKSERNTFAATAEWHHDSTYYNQFEQVALLGHDLARLEEQATVSWTYALSERNDLQLSASWDRVAFSQHSSSALSNFTYSQAAMQYSRDLSERTLWSTTVGYGQFGLISGTYLSDERFAQTSLTREQTEHWSLTGQVGYAFLSAHGVSYVCCQLAVGSDGSLYFVPFPVRQYAARGGGNYAFTAQRQGERLLLDLSASRAIEPSGFGALITEDAATASASLPLSGRLTVGAVLQWARLSDLLGRLNLQGLHDYTATVNANWLTTEHWTLQLQAIYTRQYVATPLPGIPGVTVYLNLLRQFGRLPL